MYGRTSWCDEEEEDGGAADIVIADVEKDVAAPAVDINFEISVPADDNEWLLPPRAAEVAE